METLIGKDDKGDTHPEQVDRLPNVCPCCRVRMAPIDCGYIATEEPGTQRWLTVLLRCPNRFCNRHFLAFYRYYDSALRELGYYLHSYGPQSEPKESFPESITEVSPRFVSIYNEALAAEVHNLKQICGPGYRKALEFLIKDYLIKAEAADAPKIKKMSLADCIKKLPDPKVKQVAERAAWLGNDETHYERKWADKDIGDLKKLIGLTVLGIEREILTEQLETDMPG